MKRREFSNKLRAKIVHRATDPRTGMVVCERCGYVLGKKPYEIDHIVAEALVIDKSKPLTEDDGQLLGMECCHRGNDGKTAADVRRIAKAKRVELRHLGIKKRGSKRSTFPKAPPGTRYEPGPHGLRPVRSPRS
jgi:hypothetical protein